MQYNFLNIFSDKKELTNQDNSSVNKFLLENNSSQIERLYDFYAGSPNLLYVSGFLGTGKAEIVNYSLSFLSSETIVLKYDCFNSTILDDILLSFFYDFRKLTIQNIIKEPKVKTESFAQKINSYFTTIEKPFVIIIDSFESVLKENRQEILDFISHLCGFSKIKIIFIARTFENAYFENYKVNLERMSLFALEKSIFDKLIREEKIKAGGLIIDEFYKLTRGYYFYTMISLKIMEKEQINLIDFIQNFRATFASFDEYLEKKSLELVPATSRNLFWFLSMIRHPVSADLLKLLHLYDEAKLAELKDCLILNQKDLTFFVKDYYKEQVDMLVAPNIANKIRQYIVDLYQTQLPMKPLERNVPISRQTMRREIEYHSLFLPKKPKLIENQDIDINYLQYAKGLEFEYATNSAEQKKESAENSSYIQGDVSKIKNVSIDVSGYTPQKQNLEPESIKHKIVDNIQDNNSHELHQEKDISIEELIELAENAHSKYFYTKEIELYSQALLHLDASNFDEKQSIISERLANAYLLISDNDNAIKYYKSSLEFNKEKNNSLKVNELKLKLAEIFTESYKNNQAKEQLEEIIATDAPNFIKLQAHLLLANVEEGFSNPERALANYVSAISLVDETTPRQNASELYFKYALALDDINNQREAVEYYKKCIETDPQYSSNKFLSSAYSNLATLYYEKNEISFALNYYKNALETDEKNNNFEGIYYISTKLANIYQRRDPNEAFTYLEKALESARKIGDIFYIASSSLAIGDYYYNGRQDELALKYYVETMQDIKDQFSKDNINKIQIMINDIKFRMGNDAFEKAMNKIQRQLA